MYLKRKVNKKIVLFLKLINNAIVGLFLIKKSKFKFNRWSFFGKIENLL
jgi:hypothetical protein